MSKTYFSPIVIINFLGILVLFSSSCSKDSDLLSDYVLADDKDVLFANLVVDDSFVFPSNQSMVLDVLSNDNFDENANVSIVSTTNPSIGVVQINEDNTLTYTPNSNSTANAEDLADTEEIIEDTFDYTTEVVNEDATVSSESGTVKVALGSSDAKLLFSSGFEGITLSPNDATDYQYLNGTDVETGFTWPPNIWGSSYNGLHTINEDGISNKIETVEGHTGELTSVLYNEILYSNGSPGAQTPYQINRISEDPDEYYISFWAKIDGVSLNKPNDWRIIWQYKSDKFDYQNPQPGYRISIYMYNDKNGNTFWHTKGDDQNPDYWAQSNTNVPVPRNEWFQVEVYSKVSSQADGRFWAKVNGQEIANHDGPNLGISGDSMSFMMLTQLYGNSYPAYQWIDDIEIWDGVPY